MAVIEDIEDSVSAHWPYYLGGFIAVLVFVYLYYSSAGSKSSGGTSNFTYSIGPSDAQIAAGTAQQNQLQADQTAVSLANINATASTAEAGDYFNYLTTNSANQLSAVTNTNATQLAAVTNTNSTGLAETQASDSTALAAAGYQNQIASLTSQNSSLSSQISSLISKIQGIVVPSLSVGYAQDEANAGQLANQVNALKWSV
jgi:hypothetical protein